jgi:hypothetical protein
VLVWDNLAVHKMPQLKTFFEDNADWLTVFYLPSYAPDLNPQEGIWSHAKRGIGNLAAAGVDHLAAAVKHRLKKIQHPAPSDRRLPHPGRTVPGQHTMIEPDITHSTSISSGRGRSTSRTRHR